MLVFYFWFFSALLSLLLFSSIPRYQDPLFCCEKGMGWLLHLCAYRQRRNSCISWSPVKFGDFSAKRLAFHLFALFCSSFSLWPWVPSTQLPPCQQLPVPEQYQVSACVTYWSMGATAHPARDPCQTWNIYNLPVCLRLQRCISDGPRWNPWKSITESSAVVKPFSSKCIFPFTLLDAPKLFCAPCRQRDYEV